MPLAQAAYDVSEVTGLAGVVGAGEAVRLAAATPEVHDYPAPAALPERAEQAAHV